MSKCIRGGRVAMAVASSGTFDILYISNESQANQPSYKKAPEGNVGGHWRFHKRMVERKITNFATPGRITDNCK